MIEDVTRRFDLALKSKFKEQTEVLNFLLKHERKQLCINRLCEQIIRAENYRINVSVSTYATIIQDVAFMFANACLQKCLEDHYSSAKKAEINRQQTALKDAEDLLLDLEKETIRDRSLTEIEREEIKTAINNRKTLEVQT